MKPELPNEEITKKILAELSMNPKELDEAVVHLRDWLKKQPHLPKSADDDFLKSFIIGSKSLDRAKSRLDAYYSARIRYSSPFFENRDPTQLKWCRGQKLLTIPGLTPDNCKVIMFSLPEKECVYDFEPAVIFKEIIMFYDLFIRRNFMSSGVYVLADFANLSVELSLKSSLTLSSQYAKIYQECYPIRLKGLFVFNAPTLAETMFSTFVRPFFSQKLKERMYISSENESWLEQFIPLDMLPSDYGGKSPSSTQLFEEEKQNMINMKDWFLKEGSERTMEDFRPKPDNDVMKGTFRKIEAE